MQIHCSTYSVTLNAMATQCTCSLNSIYHPHWWVQWSHRCSRVCIPVHCPWLPGCIDVLQTVLFISMIAGLFPDRPRNPEVGVLGYIVVLFSIFLRNLHTVYNSSCINLHSHQQRIHVPFSPHLNQHLSVFDNAHSNRCVVVSYSGFDWIVLMISNVEHLFMYL